MSDMPLFLHFIFGFLATVGFSIFLSSPKNSLPYAGLIGAIGWVLYVYLFGITKNPIFSNFIPATIVGILSEVSARYLKQPAIIFVIPGIIPLVPGLGMYNTMLYLVQENYELAVSTGVTAVFVGGAISLGVLLVTSLVKTLNILKFNKRSNNFNNTNQTTTALDEATDCQLEEHPNTLDHE